MNWGAADAFCRGLGDGARLPTREEYVALGTAMGYPNRYNPDMIADMRGNWFWSSSVPPRSPGYEADPHAATLDGSRGGIVYQSLRYELSVRCVRAAERG
jgi:hypothetical protein